MDALLFPSPDENAKAVLDKNVIAARYGLALSPQEARALALAHEETLRGAGRVELGPPILGLLVEAFCDSPYVCAQDYVETLCGLAAIFYSFKNATELPDAALLAAMRRFFDGRCRGSLELLEDLPPEWLVQPPPEDFYGMPEPEVFYDE